MSGSHLLALQLQDAAEGITGLRELLHLLLLCLVKLEREAAALTAALNAGVLKGWHGAGGISGDTSERHWMAGWRTYRVEGHSELLNEGVEVLGSLPAILEETGHLFNAIKMQMGRMEKEKKKKFKKEVF